MRVAPSGRFHLIERGQPVLWYYRDVSFEQGAPDNVIDGMMTQRTTSSLPTYKAVMALRPNPIAALALMGGTQGQTKAEANRHPDCLIVEGQATHSNRKRHHPVRRMRAAYLA